MTDDLSIVRGYAPEASTPSVGYNLWRLQWLASGTKFAPTGLKFKVSLAM